MPQKGYEERLAYRTAYYLANKEQLLAKRKAKNALKVKEAPPKAIVVVKEKKERTEAQKEARRVWANNHYAKNKERLLEAQKKAYNQSKISYLLEKEIYLRVKNGPTPPVENELPPVENGLPLI